jgi:hypothetical protein
MRLIGFGSFSLSVSFLLRSPPGRRRPPSAPTLPRVSYNETRGE